MSENYSSDDELFDVVEAEDHVIAQATRAEVHAKGWYHRAVHILVFNSQGQVLLQQRSLTKDTSPGKWTTSCSGHVDSGETYDTAAVRELTEELNIAQHDSTELSLIAKHGPCEQTGQEFIAIYRLEWDGEPHGPPEEIADLRWISPTELDTWLTREPAAFATSFKLVWKLSQA